MAIEERVATLEGIVVRLDAEVTGLERRVGDLEGMVAMYMLPKPPFSSSSIRLPRFPDMPIGFMGNFGYRIEKEADRLVRVVRALEGYLSAFALKLVKDQLEAVRTHLTVASDEISKPTPDYSLVVDHFIGALECMNTIIFCLATELVGAKEKGTSHQSSPQITIPKREVTRLLLQMKPESLKEDYARREAIATMLVARSEYDPSVAGYMKEQGVSKEDLEKWEEYWAEKRRNDKGGDNRIMADEEVVRELRVKGVAYGSHQSPEEVPPPPPVEARPEEARVVELLSRALPLDFRIEKVERVGIIRPRIRVTVSTRLPRSSSSGEKREWEE